MLRLKYLKGLAPCQQVTLARKDAKSSTVSGSLGLQIPGRKCPDRLTLGNFHAACVYCRRSVSLLPSDLEVSLTGWLHMADTRLAHDLRFGTTVLQNHYAC